MPSMRIIASNQYGTVIYELGGKIHGDNGEERRTDSSRPVKGVFYNSDCGSYESVNFSGLDHE